MSPSTIARVMLAGALGLLLGACFLPNNKEALVSSVTEYNNALRWGRTDWMKEHVPPEKEGSMIAGQLPGGDLRITGCEVEAVDLAGSERARARVRLEWYLLGQGRLHTSILQQTWVRQRYKGWQVVGQQVLRGAPFPPPAIGQRVGTTSQTGAVRTAEEATLAGGHDGPHI